MVLPDRESVWECGGYEETGTLLQAESCLPGRQATALWDNKEAR